MPRFFRILNVVAKAALIAGVLLGGLDSIPASRQPIEDLFKYLGLIPLHVAFWMVALSFGYISIVQGIKLRWYGQTRPVVSVNPHVSIGAYCELIVHNRSPVDATFSVTAEVYGDSWHSPPFTLPWLESADANARIVPNGRNALIPYNYGFKDDATGNGRVHLMLFNRMTSNGTVPVPLAPLVEGEISPEVVLKITVAASPTLKGRDQWFFIVRHERPLGHISIEPVSSRRGKSLIQRGIHRK